MTKQEWDSVIDACQRGLEKIKRDEAIVRRLLPFLLLANLIGVIILAVRALHN